MTKDRIGGFVKTMMRSLKFYQETLMNSADAEGELFSGSSVLVAAFGADAEVKLLHALDLFAHILEGAHRAVGGETL